MTTQEYYYELSRYTLAHKDKSFIHQHFVDAYTAQTANTETKPITIFFSLAGLYLLAHKNYSGAQIQDAHLRIAKESKDYPKFVLPENRGILTIRDVLDAAPGRERDEMIGKWCISVWAVFSDQHDKIISLTEKLLRI